MRWDPVRRNVEGYESRTNSRIGPLLRTRCSRGLDEDIGAICASIGKLNSYSFLSALSLWHQWTAYVNEITLYAEFFLVIDFLSVLNYSDNRQEWSFGLVLCVWVLENFISYKTNVVDISSGHIGFLDGQYNTIIIIFRTFSVEIRPDHQAFMLILQSCKMWGMYVAYWRRKVEFRKSPISSVK